MREYLLAALDSFRSNRLRAIITISIIAIGISSLVAIETAISVVSTAIRGSFGKMGSSTVEVLSGGEAGPPLTYGEARRLASALGSGTGGSERGGAGTSDSGTGGAGNATPDKNGLTVSISGVLSEIATVTAAGAMSDPVVRVIASDASCLATRNLTLKRGRNISDIHPADGCLIGERLCRRLFGEGDGTGESVSVAGMRLRVEGIIAQGLQDSGWDGADALIVHINTARSRGVEPEGGYSLAAMAEGEGDTAGLTGTIRGLLRPIRSLRPADEDNFVIREGTQLQQTLGSLRRKLSLAALAIGLITMLGASTGVTNMMLASVQERRCEIGLRKAVGATSRAIKGQFLTEAALLGQIGAAFGIVLGIMLGNIVALCMEGPFSVPWGWCLFSALLSLAVSVVSGLMPASRAAATDPASTLRQ